MLRSSMMFAENPCAFLRAPWTSTRVIAFAARFQLKGIGNPPGTKGLTVIPPPHGAILAVTSSG